MAKIISFQVPRKGADNLTTTERGRVAVFQIGDMKVRCIIQNCGLRGVQLTHWASGQTMVTQERLRSVRISNWARSFNGCINDREACRQALTLTEQKVGTAKMLAVILAAPVINR